MALEVERRLEHRELGLCVGLLRDKRLSSIFFGGELLVVVVVVVAAAGAAGTGALLTAVVGFEGPHMRSLFAEIMGCSYSRVGQPSGKCSSSSSSPSSQSSHHPTSPPCWAFQIIILTTPTSHPSWSTNQTCPQSTDYPVKSAGAQPVRITEHPTPYWDRIVCPRSSHALHYPSASDPSLIERDAAQRDI